MSPSATPPRTRGNDARELPSSSNRTAFPPKRQFRGGERPRRGGFRSCIGSGSLPERLRRLGRIDPLLFRLRAVRRLEFGLHAAGEERERNDYGKKSTQDHPSCSFQNAIAPCTRSGAVPPKLLRERTEASSES